jgi:hypothetical protein
VFNLPQPRPCDYTIRCKGCAEAVPAPVGTMPDTWIVAECPLCGERRRYLPADIFRGNLSHKLDTRQMKSEVRQWVK